jgi:DNA-directed RNA polymerase subunit M/transcription elongation factor TFIIS
MRSLFQNLKNKSNPELRVRVYNGEIKPEDFVTYNHEQLKSAERKAEDARIMKENMDKAMVPQAEKSVSTALTCGKCGKQRVSYSQAQTRSADEPMTTFCLCRETLFRLYCDYANRFRRSRMREPLEVLLRVVWLHFAARSSNQYGMFFQCMLNEGN